MAATNDLDFFLIFCLARIGAQTKSVSVRIGNHQPIGTPRIKRVSVLDCDRRVHGTILMAVRMEDLIYKDIYKGIHEDENDVGS